MARSFHDRRALDVWLMCLIPLFFAAIMVVALLREGTAPQEAFRWSVHVLSALAVVSVVLAFVASRRACVEVRVGREGVEVIRRYPFRRERAKYPPSAIPRPHIDSVTTSGESPRTYWRAVFRPPAGDEVILAKSIDMEDAQVLIRAFDLALGGRDRYGG